MFGEAFRILDGSVPYRRRRWRAIAPPENNQAFRVADRELAQGSKVCTEVGRAM
jgi:hypothetical protein